MLLVLNSLIFTFSVKLFIFTISLFIPLAWCFIIGLLLDSILWGRFLRCLTAMYLVRYVQLDRSVIMTTVGIMWNSGLIVIVIVQSVFGNWNPYWINDTSLTPRFTEYRTITHWMIVEKIRKRIIAIKALNVIHWKIIRLGDSSFGNNFTIHTDV